MTANCSRRGFLAASALAIAGCSKSSDSAGKPTARVTLYSSVDDVVLREIVAAFEKTSGISVDLVTDTEATKTTGLVERLLAERGAPRADVWWSSEATGTIRLASENVLAPLPEGVVPADWPREFVGEGTLWIGTAARARVIAFSESRLGAGDVPSALRDLTSERFQGKVGFADPRFGTTRSHLAAILLLAGESRTRAWLEAMKTNRARIYRSNSAIVRAIADAEIDAGLTDTDDVEAARRNRWPVAMRYEREDEPGAAPPDALPSFGAVVLPNTVAMVRSGPNPAAARTLLEFLVSERCETMLAVSESRNIPLRPALRDRFSNLRPPAIAPAPPDRVAAAASRAIGLYEDVFGG